MHIAVAKTRHLLLAIGLILLFPLCSYAADTGASVAKPVVLVSGATGRVGSELMAELQRQGYIARGLTRDADAARAESGAGYQWVAGDMRDPETLAPALEGVRYVVSAAGAMEPDGPNGPEQVDYIGTRNLVDAARKAGIEQFVMVSSIGVTHRFHLLNMTFGNVLQWKWRAEEYLRSSGLTYTIVRPGGLRPGRGGVEGLRVIQGDPKGGRYILIPDLAQLIVAALGNQDAYAKSFEVLSAPQQPPYNWHGIFAKLEADR